MKKFIYPDPALAERIQQVFTENRLIDAQVGKAIGLDRKTILGYRWGYSSPSISLIQYLVREHNVDAYWLLGLERNTNEQIYRKAMERR